MVKLFSHVSWRLLVAVLLSSGIRSHSNSTTLDIRMPGASPSKDNAYLCTSVQLPLDDQYIVRFEPKGDKDVVHHMLLLGCDKPFSWKSIWDCGHGGTCANTENIIFAWANGASDKTLPKDVGFQVGKSSGIHHLVLQVHYKHRSRDLHDNESGFVLHITPQRQPFLAGIFLMWSGEVDIPPEASGIHSDIVCKYQEQTTMYAFAFRTHAHGLGRVISGYRVNDNNWNLLGKGDPKEPQAFYPMKSINKISKGDTLAARCTYDSKGHHLKNHVFIGATGKDEMCNFYIMYYRDANEPEVSKAGCDDELARHKSLTFPSDSDTPMLKISSTHKITTDAPKYTANTNRIKTNTKYTANTHRIKTNTKNTKVSTDKMASTPQNSNNRPSTIEKSHNKILHPSLHHNMVPPSSGDGYQVVKSWPNLRGEQLGQISGVAVDSKGNVLVFHRGSRVWDYKSFDDQNIFIEETPISHHTILTLNPDTGEVIGRWGKNMFFLPHGLSLDRHDNIWLTDVGTHQVHKFPPHGGTKALLTVGEKFVPDSDGSHFCKPSDVAVEKTGSFYVADGYCNSRIVKFSAKGKYIIEFGRFGSKKGEFNLPHSIALDESRNLLYIADRQNGRVQVLSTSRDIFLPVIKKQQFGYVFALDLNRNSGQLHVINGNPRDSNSKLYKGFTLQGNHLLETWPNDNKHFHKPHDVASSADNTNLYVVEIGPNRIWKLTKQETRHNTMGFLAICSLDKDTGPCRAAMPRWYFDSKEQTCKHFIYGGCRGNENNFKSMRECEAKCTHYGHVNNTTSKGDDESGRSSESLLNILDTAKKSENATERYSTVKPTIKETNAWQNAFTHYNSTNHTTTRHIKKNQSGDSEEEVAGMIPALVILSVLAVPIVFLLLISIALRLRAYRRDSRYKANRLLKTGQDGLAVGRTRGWLSYLNCCNKQNYRFDKVNLAEFYSDSESDGV